MYPFSDLTDYAKYLKGLCEECGQSEIERCGCCPPGLSAVYDSKGNHMGCLTPNDAMIINDKINTGKVECTEGTVKAYAPNGMFIGCLSSVADFATILPSYPNAEAPFPFAMTVERNRNYARFFNSNSESTENGGCNSCGNECDEKCSCCPPGNISVFDSCGNNLGCMTATDAYSLLDRMSAEKVKCSDGYVKAMIYPTGIFYGCLTPTQYNELFTLLNP